MPRRLVRPSPLFLLLAALTWTTQAHAGGLPDPRFSIVDPVLVGSPLGLAVSQVGGTPGFDVWAKDASNTPLAGANVVIDFTFTGLTLYATQNAGTTINCATHQISQVADAQGHAVFAAQFGSWQNNRVVPVIVNGVEIARVSACSPDYDEDGRVGIFDLSVFSVDFFSQSPAPRSDFDQSGGTPGLGDLSIFSQHYLSPDNSARPLCP